MEESREIGFSCRVFFFCFARERSSRSSSGVPPMHPSASPLTTLPLSPSVAGLLSEMSAFRPFFSSGDLHVFRLLFSVLVCLSVSPPPHFTSDSFWITPPKGPCHPSGLWWIRLWVFSVLCFVKVCVACFYLTRLTSSKQKLKGANGRGGCSCSSGALLLWFVLLLLLVLDWTAVVVWCSGSAVC